jgi:hypothetical protein
MTPDLAVMLGVSRHHALDDFVLVYREDLLLRKFLLATLNKRRLCNLFEVSAVPPAALY